MSPRKWFHVADKISCRQKLTHVGAKMISCRQNAFHVAKTFSCRQKCFSCRRKINFMSPIWFHVAEKVDFSDVNLVCLFVWLNKTRTVKPLRRFHSWRLSFTQDGLAFSTKTARRTLQVQLRLALSTSWRAGSAFKISRSCWPHQRTQALHKTPPNPPNRAPCLHFRTLTLMP